MSDLKNAIKRIEAGILFPGLGRVDHEDVRAIIAAAKTTLPKTVTKWDVQAASSPGGKVKTHNTGGGGFVPYETREDAIEFAKDLIGTGWQNVSVVEVEVEE